MIAALLTLLALSPSSAQDLPPAEPPAEVAADVRAEETVSKGTIVFIHGLYMTARCWEEWQAWFDARGYDTIAPDWPGRAGKPADLRANPDPALRDLEFADVLEHHRQVVKSLPSPPILVGHSMGGLVVQRLLGEGLGRAGVAIDSAPPKGVSSMKPSFFRSNLPVLRPGSKPIELSPRKFRYAFANHLSREESLALYEHYVVPESRQAAKGPLGRDAKVDFEADRAPLLLIAGGDDHIIPASLNEKNARKYRKSPAKTDLRVFEDRTHWTLGQEGWEQVAGAAAEWLEGLEDAG